MMETSEATSKRVDLIADSRKQLLVVTESIVPGSLVTRRVLAELLIQTVVSRTAN